MSVLTTDQGQLALAIYRRDFDAAQHILSMMACRSNTWALAQQAARRAVAPPSRLPDLAPMILPTPGATYGAVLGDDPQQRVRRRA